MTTWIVARWTQPGLHLWPNAPQTRDYLGVEHRHLFHVELRIEAPANNERSFEFHDVRDVGRRCLREVGMWHSASDLLHFGDWSCEMIATLLTAKVRVVLEFDGRMECSVFEDGENGATVETP